MTIHHSNAKGGELDRRWQRNSHGGDFGLSERQSRKRQAVGAMLVAALLGLAAACASAPTATEPSATPTTTASGSLEAAIASTARELESAHSGHRVAGAIDDRRLPPEAFWETVRPLIESAPERFRMAQIGESVEGRPLWRIDFGRGDTTVLLWSQMHGNESTATRALADVFHYLAENPDDPHVRRIESELAVTFVPLLNPDGAARFVRHNAVGIDINRDARALATPEGRALKQVRDEIDAAWGFNLHDQNVRTRLGGTDRGVQIALLAPPPGDGETSPANENAKRLAALIALTLRSLVGDSIARYSESFNPRAFGDLMTRWGTATVLIESGGSLDDRPKELPRRANFVAVLAALDAIASGTWRSVPSSAYAELPPNGRAVADLLLVGGSIVLPGHDPVRADVRIDFDDTLDPRVGVVGEVGDLAEVEALRTLDITGLYLVPDPDTLSPEGAPHLRPGEPLRGVIARDPRGEEVVWRLDGGWPIEAGPEPDQSIR